MLHSNQIKTIRRKPNPQISAQLEANDHAWNYELGCWSFDVPKSQEQKNTVKSNPKHWSDK